MSEIERMTVTLPVELASSVKRAVEAGDYASTTDVVSDALREWELKRNLQSENLARLKADIDRGFDDARAGRVKDFDEVRIAELGRRLSANRSFSA